MLTRSGIEKYFMAEKNESMLFMTAGVIAIALAMFFFFYQRTSFARGLAVPLLLIGVIQFIVGFTVYSRADRQRTDMVYSLDMNPARLRNEEFPRMEKVMKSFVTIRYTEIAMVAIGLVLFFVFRGNPERNFWCGVGIALSFQAVACLVMDFFAEKRGHVYFEGLRSFLNG